MIVEQHLSPTDEAQVRHAISTAYTGATATLAISAWNAWTEYLIATTGKELPRLDRRRIEGGCVDLPAPVVLAAEALIQKISRPTFSVTLWGHVAWGGIGQTMSEIRVRRDATGAVTRTLYVPTDALRTLYEWAQPTDIGAALLPVRPGALEPYPDLALRRQQRTLRQERALAAARDYAAAHVTPGGSRVPKPPPGVAPIAPPPLAPVVAATPNYAKPVVSPPIVGVPDGTRHTAHASEYDPDPVALAAAAPADEVDAFLQRLYGSASKA